MRAFVLVFRVFAVHPPPSTRPLQDTHADKSVQVHRRTSHCLHFVLNGARNCGEIETAPMDMKQTAGNGFRGMLDAA